MEHDSPLRTGRFTLSSILLLLVVTSSAQPINYNDVANLLPTEPQTTNDTLAAIVQDPVVQDAVHDTIGNGTLEGLVVKKRVLIMPATEPNKVVSRREQVLVVPMTNLEDVRKNITESADGKTDGDDLALTEREALPLAEDGEKGYYGDENDPPDTSQRVDFHKTLDEFFENTRKPYFSVEDDNTPHEVPYLPPNPRQEMERLKDLRPPSTISVPIVAFLDPAKIPDDNINVPISAALLQPDVSSIGRLELLENERDEVQRDVQDYINGNSWSVDPNYWLSSPSSQTPLLYEPNVMENQYQNDVRPETPLSVAVPNIGIVTPLVWTSDADIDYPKNPGDMDTAADIVFRPLFRFRQEEQRRSWRRGADSDYRRTPYRRYNSYNSYPKRDYRYRPRYPSEYY